MTIVFQWHEKTRCIFVIDNDTIKKRISFKQSELNKAVQHFWHLAKKKDMQIVVAFGMRRFSYVRSITLFMNLIAYTTRKKVGSISVQENATQKEILKAVSSEIVCKKILEPVYQFPPNITQRKNA